jgi:hypothetical protein
MINAREEFESSLSPDETLSGEPSMEYEVLCAWVYFARDREYEANMDNAIYLRKSHTPQEYEEFLTKIDCEYDNGYGTQKLFGKIWLTDGSWFNRREYDGAESWKYMRRPETPDGCECPPVVKSASKE